MSRRRRLNRSERPKSFDPAVLREGIAALAGQLLIGERHFPGFLQRDQGKAAEFELGSAAPDRAVLDPIPAPGGPHNETETLPHCVHCNETGFLRPS